jgi:hypothetical protein
MALQADRQGFLKQSLVSGGISPFSATPAGKRFSRPIINAGTGRRCCHRPVDAETGPEVFAGRIGGSLAAIRRTPNKGQMSQTHKLT